MAKSSVDTTKMRKESESIMVTIEKLDNAAQELHQEILDLANRREELLSMNGSYLDDDVPSFEDIYQGGSTTYVYQLFATVDGANNFSNLLESFRRRYDNYASSKSYVTRNLKKAEEAAGVIDKELKIISDKLAGKTKDKKDSKNTSKNKNNNKNKKDTDQNKNNQNKKSSTGTRAGNTAEPGNASESGTENTGGGAGTGGSGGSTATPNYANLTPNNNTAPTYTPTYKASSIAAPAAGVTSAALGTKNYQPTVTEINPKSSSNYNSTNYQPKSYTPTQNSNTSTNKNSKNTSSYTPTSKIGAEFTDDNRKKSIGGIITSSEGTKSSGISTRNYSSGISGASNTTENSFSEATDSVEDIVKGASKKIPLSSAIVEGSKEISKASATPIVAGVGAAGVSGVGYNLIHGMSHNNDEDEDDIKVENIYDNIQSSDSNAEEENTKITKEDIDELFE